MKQALTTIGGPLDRLIVENDEDCDEVEDILDECDIAYFAV